MAFDAKEVEFQIRGLAGSFTSDMASSDTLADIGLTIAQVPWKPGLLVVEIGTHHGKTAAFIATLLRRMELRCIPVVSIDPFGRIAQQDDPHNPVGSYDRYQETIDRFQVADQCMAITAFSAHAADAIAPQIGLLIVDGHHSYEACLADLMLYAPKVVQGGFIFVDDDRLAIYPGVVKAIDHFFSAIRPRLTVRRGVGHAIAQVNDRE